MGRMIAVLNRYLCIGLPVYVIGLIFWPLPPLQERSIFILWLMLIHFFTQIDKSDKPLSIAYNLSLAGVSSVVFGYVALFHERIAETVGFPTTLELVLGIVTLVLVLEATRMAMGFSLVCVILVFLVYGLLGQYIPFEYGGHTGFGIDRIVNATYLTTNGIFGIIIYTLYKYVFLFIIFGNLLEATGALTFITNFAFALVGRIRGGPAMIAIVSSGLFGSISGSAVANVAVTGSVTIPMMKKIGFEPHVAGAVEAAASNGGQLMPPIMGAAAFLMAQFLGIGYLQVIKAALLPAIIYYLSMGLSVYFYAKRRNLSGIDTDRLPSMRSVLLSADALVFIFGLSALIFFLVMRLSPNYASLWAMLVMIAVSYLGSNRITPRRLIQVFEKSPRTFLDVGVAGTGVGIIVAIVMLTGLAMRFSGIIITLSGGSLIVTLILTMLVSFILGMGLPTTVCYIILITLLSQTLTQLHVLPLAGHLFIFYAGLMSMVTPPVGLAAYAGASLAGANMWRTAVTASLLSLPAYILPYIFVLDPSLILQGTSWYGSALALVRSLFGCAAVAYAIIGPRKSNAEFVRRALCLVGGLLLIWPAYWADAVAFVLFLAALGPLALRSALAKGGRSASERAISSRTNP